MGLDVVFVSPNSAVATYQGLANRWTAIEVPFWSLLLAESCRAKNYSVAILDCLAENLTPEQAVSRIKDLNPKLVCFVTYGPNPNSGVTQFSGTLAVAKLLRESYPEYKTIAIGTLSSALPIEVLKYDCFDFVTINEGVKTLHKLLETDLKTDLHKIPALGYKDDGKPKLNNGLNSLVTTEEMDHILPGYAWDLLPFKEKPFDLYRAHHWHALYQEKYRTPFVSLLTSQGCQFSCGFCQINIVNRTSTEEKTHAAHSNIMRFWSVEKVLSWFDILVQKYDCHTIRLVDEMWMLNRKYYPQIIKGLIDRGYGDLLKMWCYARIDTVNPKFLDDARKAGMLYYGLGIESSEQSVRQEIEKGKFKEVNIREVVRQIKAAGSFAGNNFIFGLTGDTHETMQKTLDLAIELNGEFSNFYPCMALPGSPLYWEAKEKGYELPKTYEAWSFHSYECQPLPTATLSAAEVLKFRDEAWFKYFDRPEYQEFIRTKLGDDAANNIKELCKVKLSRKLLGHKQPEIV